MHGATAQSLTGARPLNTEDPSPAPALATEALLQVVDVRIQSTARTAMSLEAAVLRGGYRRCHLPLPSSPQGSPFRFFTNPADHRKRNSGRNSAENRIFRTEGEFKFKKRNSGNSGRNSATFRRNSATFRRNSGLSGGKCHFLTTNAPNI